MVCMLYSLEINNEPYCQTFFQTFTFVKINLKRKREREIKVKKKKEEKNNGNVFPTLKENSETRYVRCNI